MYKGLEKPITVRNETIFGHDESSKAKNQLLQLWIQGWKRSNLTQICYSDTTDEAAVVGEDGVQSLRWGCFVIHGSGLAVEVLAWERF